MSISPEAFREASRNLITSVALITSIGKNGPNVMSAEWTFQVSYRPMRLITLIHRGDATHDNILETREFGVNFASDDQAALASLAGAYTGKEVNKLSSQLFKTHPAKRIRAPMVSGCFLNAECRLLETFETGDHTLFLGEVLEITSDPNKSPLLYSQRRYWQKGPQLPKKPLAYVTCTISGDQFRVNGRLQGVENYPQTATVTVSGDNGVQIVRESVRTDEHGYFELVKPNNPSLKGTYVAKVEWNGQVGSAVATVD